MKKKVIILGGGVAGLSAAHELAERDFEVHVYEKLSIPGGKARSTDVPKTDEHGGLPLPGEHGFRFFPRFYIHITDLMKRIPLGNGKTVFDNLVDTSRVTVASHDRPPFPIVNRFPKSRKDLEDMMSVFHQDIGIPKDAQKFFVERLWQIMTSCWDRRVEEYERIGWWEFIEAGQFNDAYRTFLAEGFTRTLVAAQPQIASTKTVGDILVQLVFDMIIPGVSSDRVLNGPTNEVWINPWVDYLTSQLGVTYHLHSEVTEIQCDVKNHVIRSVGIVENGEHKLITGDHYISALPVEKLAMLLNDDLLSADPTLELLRMLANSVNWMNGIQYFLPEDVLNTPETHGHVLMVDTPWALTAISQRQFWQEPYNDFSGYYDGSIKGILSVDVSDWFNPAPVFEQDPVTKEIRPVMELTETGQEYHLKLPANDCTPSQIIATVWRQMQESLNKRPHVMLTDYVLAYLDPSIENRRIGMHRIDPLRVKNSEPLLVNATGTWFLRPQAHTRISNFYLTGDYVKTNTDLATMEGANESARRAVNALLDDNGIPTGKCKIWCLHEPLAFAKWRHMDKVRFRRGLRWRSKFHPVKLVLFWVMAWLERAFRLTD